jgi:hypothetical protein
LGKNGCGGTALSVATIPHIITMVAGALIEARVNVLKRILLASKAVRPSCKLFSTSAVRWKKLEETTVSIGDVTKVLKRPSQPELVPIHYLPKDSDIPLETLKVCLCV